MNPTDILAAKHRVIQQFFDCLGRIVERAESDRKLDEQSWFQAS